MTSAIVSQTEKNPPLKDDVKRQEAPSVKVEESAGIPSMISLGLIHIGIGSVDNLNNSMVQNTISLFTDRQFVISSIMDFNRFFGFMVQPYVAWKGDQIQTRFGRRKPFLLIGIPCVIIFLLLLGKMPILFAGSSRGTWFALFTLILFNVGLQVFHDVNLGVEGPLYGDTFSHKKLGLASGFKTVSNTIMLLIMSQIGMQWAMTDEFGPFLISGILLTVALIVVVFCIRERPAVQKKSAERYNPLKHIKLLIDEPVFLRIATIGAITQMIPASGNSVLFMFAKKSLHVSYKEFGDAMMCSQIVAMVVALPIGYLVDRLGPKKCIFMGLFLYMLTTCSFAFYVHDFATLRQTVMFNAASNPLLNGSLFSLVFLQSPKEERGKIWGLVQFVRSFSAFLIVPAIGLLYDFTKDYRYGYMVNIVLCIIGMIYVIFQKEIHKHEGT
jgi:maltose/moltooligosaccharide transporter